MANCLREDKDPFGIYKQIYLTPPSAGGIGAKAMPGCPEEKVWGGRQPPDGYDCRDQEHYFLGLLEDYRLNGDEFRQELREATDLERKKRLRAQYFVDQAELVPRNRVQARAVGWDEPDDRRVAVPRWRMPARLIENPSRVLGRSSWLELIVAMVLLLASPSERMARRGS